VEEGRQILNNFNHPLVTLSETMDGGPQNPVYFC